MTFFDDRMEFAENDCKLYNERQGKFSSCPRCKGKGWLMEIVIDDGCVYTPLKPCPDCHNQSNAERTLAANGIDSKLTFENYKITNMWQGKIKESAMKYNEHFFFIGGQSGCGKTHICSAICRKFAMQNLSVKIMRWSEDSKRLKEYVNDAEYQHLIDEYKSGCDLLYIDDLFKGAVTDADVKLAYEIIDYRYRNRMKTIISSEWMLPDVSKIDSAIGGRIEEMSKGFCFNIGKDEARNWRRK